MAGAEVKKSIWIFVSFDCKPMKLQAELTVFSPFPIIVEKIQGRSDRQIRMGGGSTAVTLIPEKPVKSAANIA